jgi:SAM-dependent methyltransferase
MTMKSRLELTESESLSRAGAMDPHREHWGNFEANLVFLDRTGLLGYPATICEIGCHRGRLLRFLASQRHQVVGCDLEEPHVRICAQHVPVCVADGQFLPFRDGTFDIVMTFDVFEHMPDSNAHLTEVKRVLRRGGCYVMQTPNKWTNMVFHALICARGFGIRRAFDFLKPPGHCSLHNFWQLRDRLERHGFAVRYYDVPVVNEHFRNKLRRYAGPLGIAALSIYNPDRFPLWLRTNFYLVARLSEKDHCFRPFT